MELLLLYLCLIYSSKHFKCMLTNYGIHRNVRFLKSLLQWQIHLTTPKYQEISVQYVHVYNSLYKVLGPISCAVGGFILVAAIFYYCCYGLAEQSGRQRHTSSIYVIQARKESSVWSKSNTSHHGMTAYSSVNNERAQDGKDKSHDSSSKSRRHSSHSSLHRQQQQQAEKDAALAQERPQRLAETVEINMGAASEDAALAQWEH